MTFEEVLTRSGWKMTDACACSGGKRTYAHKEQRNWKVFIYLSRKSYAIQNGPKVISSGRIESLEDALKMLAE